MSRHVTSRPTAVTTRIEAESSSSELGIDSRSKKTAIFQIESILH